VLISDHAKRRASERMLLTRKRIAELKRRLVALLKVGVQPDKRGAIHVFLDGGYEAVLVPDMGHWTVVTILEPPDVIITEEHRAPQWPVALPMSNVVNAR